MKNLKKKRKRTEQDHPLWSTFEEYMSNAVHFGTVSMSVDDLIMTKKNRSKWSPYWLTFLHGVMLGRDQVILTHSKLLGEEFESTRGMENE